MQKIDIDLKKDYPAHTQLIEQLCNLGYVRVPMVLDPGEFSVRGGIIDVYPVNHSHPLRIEYFDNEIERLNSFNIHSQRSISKLQSTQIHNVKLRAEKFYFSQAPEKAEYNILADIEPGDAVVHEIYGIGIFKGLQRLTISGREGEYWFIQYKDEDKLFVPLDQVHLIYKYSAGELVPKINSLSDGSWNKITKRAKKAIEELAEDIYLMQKIRGIKEGFSFSEDTVWQIDLERSFIHQETPDQLKALAAVKKDMESTKPMDRLVCGDVGYGKTEIILRAAFKACENKKQIAILVPTTILADQHYRTFKERFSAFNYRVEVLSRFKTKAEQTQILTDLKDGELQVIVGTHRLLQKDIEFHDLGLLIVDEEQRFGVTHKERLKQLKENVDVISITATPIPRTLYMSLTGAKDFSVLETAPRERKPVLTSVHEYNDELVKKAITHEIKRKGQVYYLFNNVQQIYKKVAFLKKMLPQVSFAVAHGQLKPQELETIFHDFYENKFQVLVCTTIIENGIDLPNVNTIILDKAENLGLAQIHQLRGRVGRTRRQAFAYLFYTDASLLTAKAKERLKAIKEYSSLGAGYKLALKDLEIRGAGTLLGKKQHGHMTSIGFDLYCKLLDESVHNINKKPLKKRPVIILDKTVKAYVPDTYISNPRERMALYKRIMNLYSQQELDDLKVELEDRYGRLPSVVSDLFCSIRKQLF